METITSGAVYERLQVAGVLPTLQRLAIGAVLLQRPVHMTAEQVLAAARTQLAGISRATVYGTLQTFVQHGLLRELVMNGEATIYDSNTRAHHHIYHIDTGEVHDLPDGQLKVSGMPALRDDLEMAEVDIIVRVRRRKTVG